MLRQLKDKEKVYKVYVNVVPYNLDNIPEYHEITEIVKYKEIYKTVCSLYDRISED